MPEQPFVPSDFVVPRALAADGFRLEPLGPQHNDADHAAWTSSIEHIRATPGMLHDRTPPDTMPEQLRENLREQRPPVAAWVAFVHSGR